MHLPLLHNVAIVCLASALATPDSSAEPPSPRDAPAAFAQPFRTMKLRGKPADPDGDPWRKLIPGRIHDLPDTATATASLMEGRVIVLCGEDGTTLRFFDINQERIATEITADAPITALYGAGRDLVGYSQKGKSLSLRSLPDLATAKHWTVPPGNIVDAIGVGENAREVLVLTRARRLIPIDFQNPEHNDGTVNLSEIQPDNRHFSFIRPDIKPCTRLAVSGDLQTIHFGGYVLTRKAQPLAIKLPFHAPGQPPLSLGASNRWGCGHWVLDDAGNVLATANTLQGKVATSTHGEWFGTSAFSGEDALHIVHSKNLAAAFTISPLTEWPSGFAGEKLPGDQRLFLCPSLGKIAILNQAANQLYVRDLDFKRLASAMPVQTSAPVIILDENKPPTYMFRFSRPDMIESIRPAAPSDTIRVEAATGRVEWKSPAKKGVFTVELSLKGGGRASGIVELVVPPRENGWDRK